MRKKNERVRRVSEKKKGGAKNDEKEKEGVCEREERRRKPRGRERSSLGRKEVAVV